MMFSEKENSGKGGFGGHASNQPPVVIDTPVVYKFSPVTNADRLRSMSDEELAEFLYVKTCEDGYPQFGTIREWLDWLKEEAPYVGSE